MLQECINATSQMSRELLMNYYRLGAQQLWEVYRQHYALRLKLNSCPELLGLFVFIEGSIANSQKKKGLFSVALEWVSTPSKKNLGDNLFQEAFLKMDCFEQIIYYSCLLDWLSETPIMCLDFSRSFEFVGEFRSGSFLDSWVKCLIEVDHSAQRLKINNMPLNLHHYLVRKGNTQDRLTFVLEPTRSTVTSYRIAVNSPMQFEQCFVAVNYALQRAHREAYSQILRNWSVPVPEEKIISSSFSDCLRQNSIHTYCPPRPMVALTDIEQEISEIHHEGSEHGSGGPSALEIFNSLMPGYDLSLLTQDDAKSFRVLSESAKFRLSQSVFNNKLIKFTITLRYPKAFVAEVLSIPKQVEWNRQVQLSTVKQRLPKQNSAIIYHKHRASPFHNSPRDFVFLRHVFTVDNKHFILDKSVEREMCPKLADIPRSEIVFRMMWAEQKGQDANQTLVTALAEIHYKCSIGLEREIQLTERYLLELLDFQAYLGIYRAQGNPYFDLKWRSDAGMSFSLDIHSRQSERFLYNLCSEINPTSYVIAGGGGWDSESSSRGIYHQTKVEQPAKQSAKQPAQTPNAQMQSLKKQVQQLTQHICQQNTKCYTRNRYMFKPIPCPYSIQTKYTNPIWRDNWQVHSTGIVCVDTNKLKRQNNFFKYLIPTLTSPSDIMNITLPVEICSEYSLLEATARSMCLAPLLLERAAQCADPVERFKYCMAFGLGQSLLSVEVDQPFIPMLGETFQGWINGCPIYLEQSSISPPLTNVFMEGRGYKLYGNFSSHRQISSNQVLIYNDGELMIEFTQSKQRVHFRSPTGEVEGLVSGEKTFKFKDNGYFFEQKNCLYCQMCFRPSLLKMAWSRKQGDSLEGTVVQTNRAFLDKLQTSNRKLKLNLNQTQIISSVSGRWTQSLLFDGIEYYNLKTDVPCVLDYESHPLASDSVLREDISLRKQQEYKRSHTQRERLQNIQRQDTKKRKGK